MPWQTLSLHFKQTYEGGYRYFDNCGEFMIEAVEKLNVISSEIKPTGAKMEIPERGVNATCDANSLVVVQELPPAGDESYFVNLCKEFADLANFHFEPTKIVRNGFLWKSYAPFAQVPDMLAASLKFGGDFQAELAKIVGMVPEHKRLDYFLTSGSKDLQVILHPVTFERVNLSKRNPGFRASGSEKSRIDRFNQFANRIGDALSNALVLDVDLMENDPPQAVSLDEHFGELKKKSDSLRTLFSIG